MARVLKQVFVIFSIFAAVSAAAAETPDRYKLQTGIDVSYVDASGYQSWTEGFVGKLRYDDNNDGLQGDAATEPPIEGVVVELYDAAGNLVGTDTTDADGLYLFTGLRAGDYTVQIPAGQTGQTMAGTTVDLADLWSSDGNDVAGDDSDDNGVDPADKATDPITAAVTLAVTRTSPRRRIRCRQTVLARRSSHNEVSMVRRSPLVADRRKRTSMVVTTIW